MNDDQRQRMKDIAERLGRGLDEIDACIARTGVMTDEITQVMQESLARRTYTMSLMAMVFLPSTFLTGLFWRKPGGNSRRWVASWLLHILPDVGRVDRGCYTGGCGVVTGCKI